MSLNAIRSGLRGLFRKDAVERDLDDEVMQYFELSVHEYMHSGLSREAAERRARIELGGLEATKERVRSSGWEASVEALLRDLRFAARGLCRNPAFTAVVVLTLALGVGVNTAMFSVVNAVMLRPLPYRDFKRLTLIWTDDTRRGLHQEGSAYRTILDWRNENRAFDDIGYFATNRSTLATTDAGTIIRERTRNAFVSANLFGVLGVAPIRGRVLSVDDESTAAHVAVISYGLWQRRFSGDPNVLGRTIDVDASGGKEGIVAIQIVGVMPRGFFFPDKLTELWTPATTYWRFQRESAERFAPDARRWTAIGRLKPGVSPSDARADLARIGQRLSTIYRSDVPDFPGFTASVVPILDFVTGKNTQSALWMLLGAVGLVLIVACANVANLLLARGAARHQEFVIRRALGAARSRLVRQLMVESMLLATIGGAFGLVLAVIATRMLGIVAANRVPRIDEMSVDIPVLAFAAVASAIAGIVFGVMPAFRVSRVESSEMLTTKGSAGGTVRARQSRGLLVAAECAIAIVLLTGAGLLLRSLERLRSTEPGFDPSNVLAMRIEFPPEAGPRAGEPAKTSLAEPARARARKELLDDAATRLEAIPGVEEVGFIDDLFVNGQGNKSITIPGRAGDSLSTGELNEGFVSPGFFAALRVPLRRGRYLTRDDALTKIQALWSPISTDLSLADNERRSVPEPVVVNEAFARRFFPDEDPVGKRFCIDPTSKTYWYVIVGVVGDMHRQGLGKNAIPEYFGPFIPSPNGRVDVLVRTHRDPLAAAPTVRRLVTSAIPGVLIPSVSTAERQLGEFDATRNFQTWLFAVFATVAMTLAAVGVFGVVHYTVAERTREIGVRMALGARPADVTRLVISQGMRMPGVGIVLGSVASLWLTRLMSRFLFEVGATDAVTFAVVGLVLAAVAALACYVPARRAARTDVVTVLRQD
jgi:putative ABC transport system permease protein